MKKKQKKNEKANAESAAVSTGDENFADSVVNTSKLVKKKVPASDPQIQAFAFGSRQQFVEKSDADEEVDRRRRLVDRIF